jgi:hypothetical protein
VSSTLTSLQGSAPRVSDLASPFAEFMREEWMSSAAMAVKKSTMKFCDYQLEKYVLPEFGFCSLNDVKRARIESLLSKMRQKGHATSKLPDNWSSQPPDGDPSGSLLR